MSRSSLVKGRRAEQDVARRLTRWAAPHYTFRRRGLGHAGIRDLIVEAHSAIAWPFVISVKAAPAPTLAVMLERTYRGADWPWWSELEGDPDLVAADTGIRMREYRQARAWLIWRASATWFLSCATLGGLAMPPRLSILPTPAGWPAFTMRLDHFLSTVGIDAVLVAIADGWGDLERASARWAP